MEIRLTLRNRHLLALLLSFFALAAPAPAQTAPAAGADSLRLVRHEQYFGIGHTNSLDTYLTPVEYVGASLFLLHRTERTARWGKERVAVQATYSGYAALPRSKADDDPALEGGLNAAVAWLYRFRPVGRWAFALGGMAEAESGFTYLVRGGNNPAQGRLAVHLGMTGRVVRPFRVGRQQWEARAQVDVPLVGGMFTPNYGQSYYEIFSLGHYDKNVRATHPWNAPSARLTATLTLPLWGARLSLGYNGEARQSHVNHLKHHTWNHHFIIGYVRTLRLLR